MNAQLNLIIHNGQVNREQREQMLGQRAMTLWLTGLSAAGKSTLAYALEDKLASEGRACYVLDGDNVRHGLNRDLGFSSESRSENIRRVAEVARLMNDAGLIVITAFISPFQHDRELARRTIGTDLFKEIYVSTSLATCEQRDPKGFYARARQGIMPEFTGVSSPYEPPEHPDININTERCSIEHAVVKLADFVYSCSLSKEL
jgi:adenylyl-sulfate kinase